MDVWPCTWAMIDQAAKGLQEEIYEVWKGYHLLRTMERIELNSGNGRKGGHVVDFTPLNQRGDMKTLVDVVCATCGGTGMLRGVPYGKQRRDEVCPRCGGMGRRREPVENAGLYSAGRRGATGASSRK